MSLRLFACLVSLAVHGTLAALMLWPTGSAALEEGSGHDIMVVDQGVAVEGFAKLGEDEVSVEPVETPPLAAAQTIPEQIDQVEDQQVITSISGPEQEDIKKPDQEVVEQPQPPQVAAVEQENVVVQHESSGVQKKGGSTTARFAYMGKLRSHLEHSKVNPGTQTSGTAVVRFKVRANGELVSREIESSSGSRVLDQAALDSIEKAAPFPPMPKDLGSDDLEISVPFKFSVR
jgi:periplasmic protein TonB